VKRENQRSDTVAQNGLFRPDLGVRLGLGREIT